MQQPGTVQVQGLTSWQGPQSPARAAGIQAGDVIVSIDGHAVHNLDQVSSRDRREPGSQVDDRRDGATVT